MGNHIFGYQELVSLIFNLHEIQSRFIKQIVQEAMKNKVEIIRK